RKRQRPADGVERPATSWCTQHPRCAVRRQTCREVTVRRVRKRVLTTLKRMQDLCLCVRGTGQCTPGEPGTGTRCLRWSKYRHRANLAAWLGSRDCETPSCD